MQLGDEQIKALEDIKDFIQNEPFSCYSLRGAAGTGKTTVLREIVNFLEDEGIQYCLCAPTHKAALVMQNYSDREACTIHSMLALSPNLDVLHLNLNDLHFITRGRPNTIPIRGVVICDEASMIPDDLYDLLEEKCNSVDTKIIYILDPAQLAPVKSSELSKTCKCECFSLLTKIYRQASENALIPTLQKLRDEKIDKFNTCQGTESQLIVEPDIKAFVNKAVQDIKIAIDNKDILYTKVLTYTNARIVKYNQVIRKFLWNDNDEYHVGDILSGYDNGETACHTKYYNSMDYIVEEVHPIIKVLKFLGTVKGYNLQLWDSYNKIHFEIFMLSRKDNNFEKIAETIEQMRTTAVELKKIDKKRSGIAWRNYFTMIQSFTCPINLVYDGRLIRKKTFDYGYALSIHKSQGSTYNSVFVDMKDVRHPMLTNDEIRQLQYVALSRTKTSAYIYD